jgi:hypothetical protein
VNLLGCAGALPPDGAFFSLYLLPVRQTFAFRADEWSTGAARIGRRASPAHSRLTSTCVAVALWRKGDALTHGGPTVTATVARTRAMRACLPAVYARDVFAVFVGEPQLQRLVFGGGPRVVRQPRAIVLRVVLADGLPRRSS